MNELKKLNEFKEVLENYRLSDEARQTLSVTQMVLFIGPSSAGRNTIINELLKSGKYHFIVSDTTRQPRVNDGILEQNGREYWFRKEVDFLADLRAGEFLEAAVIHDQQVSGISMRGLRTAANENKIAVNEIEVVGADNIHAAKPDALFLFVVPPSFDEWIARMTARGSLPSDEVTRRMQSAVIEISAALNRDFYQFIVNDTFMQTTKRVDALIAGTLLTNEEQKHGQDVAQALLHDIKTFLTKP